MGEAKRKRDAQTPFERMLTDVSRKMANDGKIIESGWAIFRSINKLEDIKGLKIRTILNHPQLDLIRIAYMSGAEHTFSTWMGSMDPDGEPTEADMRRMDLLYSEIINIRNELTLVYKKPQGSA